MQVNMCYIPESPSITLSLGLQMVQLLLSSRSGVTSPFFRTASSRRPSHTHHAASPLLFPMVSPHSCVVAAPLSHAVQPLLSLMHRATSPLSRMVAAPLAHAVQPLLSLTHCRFYCPLLY